LFRELGGSDVGAITMKKVFLGCFLGVMSAALLCSTALVSAQAALEIPADQERSVYTNIYGQRVVTETTPQFPSERARDIGIKKAP
jgi:hypothetical protein